MICDFSLRNPFRCTELLSCRGTCSGTRRTSSWCGKYGVWILFGLLFLFLSCSAAQATFPRDLDLTGRVFLERYAHEAKKLKAPAVKEEPDRSQAVLQEIQASWYGVRDGLSLVLFRRGVSPRLLGIGVAFMDNIPQEDWKRCVGAVVMSLTPRLGEKYRTMLYEELLLALEHRQAHCSYRTYAEQKQFVVWPDWEGHSAALFVWPEIMDPTELYWLP